MEKSQDILVVRDPRVAKLLLDNTRRKILMLLRFREMSPSELAVILGKNISSIMHHLRTLEEAGLVVNVRSKRRRNFIEKFYRAAAKKFVISYELSEGLVPGGEETFKFVEGIARGAVEAMKAFGYDPQDDEKLVELFRKFLSLRSAAYERVAQRQVSKVCVNPHSYWLLLEILSFIYIWKNPEFRAIIEDVEKTLGEEM